MLKSAEVRCQTMNVAEHPGAVSWKKRLYDAYVSSGQGTVRHAKTGSGVQAAFLPRKAMVRRMISRYLPADRSAAILDIGCGHGVMVYFLTAAGYTNVSGVDVSREQVDLASQLGVANVFCSPALDYARGLPSGSLDVVLLLDILEHLEPQELFDLTDEIYRILRPGGMCLIHVPNAEGLLGMWVRYGDLTHVQAFTRVSMKQLLATVGFSRIESYEEEPVIRDLPSAVRRVMWSIGTIPLRLVYMSEAGATWPILSQNMVTRAFKPAGA
jgi:2-polyprenyl-3-methyl-5-hydroxy-6-metoxy-1,4-benzoquinol methylase